MRKSGELYKVDYPQDCQRIRQALWNYGYDATLRDAEDLWRKYSDTMCAGWLMVDGYTMESITKIIEEMEL